MQADPDAPALVLVTHHVEEIPAGFTHALLMSKAQVVAQGPIKHVLTDQNLTAAFGLPLSVLRWANRWSARAL